MRGLTLLLILLATACHKPAPLPDPRPTDDDTGPFGLFPGAIGEPSRYDEPISWRYSLGGGLASIGRIPSIVAEFHEFNRRQPRPITLPPAMLVPPRTMRRILVEPAAFVAPNSRWKTDPSGEYLVMDNLDPRGRPEENADLPLSVDRTGVYRMWIRYRGNADGIILTALDLLRKGHEADGPLLHEEINDYPTPAPTWTSFLVPLRAGEYIIRLKPAPIVHTGVSVAGARRPISWHGWALAGDSRRIGSIYLTDELWKDAPDPPALAEIKHSQLHPNPSEWIQKVPLDDPEKWRQWQIRPIPWDLADRFPDLFQRSLAFWKQRAAALIAPEQAQLRPLPESAGLPAFDTIEHAQALFRNRDHFDFRSPQRQPIFDDEWNMIGSPAQIDRRKRTLLDRVIDQPRPPFVWYSAFELLGGRPMPLNRWKNAHWWWGDYDVDGTLSGQYFDDVTPFEVAVPIAKPGTYRFSVEVLDQPNRRLTGAMHFEVWTISDGKTQIARGDHACAMGRGGLQWVDLDPPLHVGDASTVTLKISRIDSATIARQCPGTSFTYRGFHGIRATAALNTQTERPATISVEEYRNHATPAWMPAGARYFSWFATNPHQESVYKEPLSQDFRDGASWPLPSGHQDTVQIDLARDSTGTAQIGLRNRTKAPVRLDVDVGALKNESGTEFKNRIQWRVIAFAPDQPGWWRDDRTRWSPFALLRRPFVTVPPYNVAGLWITIDGHGLPPGDYTATVTTIDGGRNAGARITGPRLDGDDRARAPLPDRRRPRAPRGRRLCGHIPSIRNQRKLALAHRPRGPDEQIRDGAEADPIPADPAGARRHGAGYPVRGTTKRALPRRLRRHDHRRAAPGPLVRDRPHRRRDPPRRPHHSTDLRRQRQRRRRHLHRGRLQGGRARRPRQHLANPREPLALQSVDPEVRRSTVDDLLGPRRAGQEPRDAAGHLQPNPPRPRAGLGSRARPAPRRRVAGSPARHPFSPSTTRCPNPGTPPTRASPTIRP